MNTGQSVMELETDKAVVEVPSSVSGTVQEIRVKEGDKIKVGQVIFTVDGAEGKPAAHRQAKPRRQRKLHKSRRPARSKGISSPPAAPAKPLRFCCICACSDTCSFRAGQ